MNSYVLCRLTIAFVWMYHGLVPKLLGPHIDEVAMNIALGLTSEGAQWLAKVGGMLEILFSVAVIVFWQQRWPLVLSAASMVLLLIFSVFAVPSLVMGAFNPVTTNLCVFTLSLVALNLAEKHSGRPPLVAATPE